MTLAAKPLRDCGARPYCRSRSPSPRELVRDARAAVLPEFWEGHPARAPVMIAVRKGASNVRTNIDMVGIARGTAEVGRARRTVKGRWAILHASWVNLRGDKAITVIFEEAAPAEVAPVIMSAYGLTGREQTICELVCQGLPTRQIADRLHLTTDTIQDHLKSVFDRTGVHSRGELVAAILQREYLPRAIAGDPLGRSGAVVAR